jgi:hypothetical protein
MRRSSPCVAALVAVCSLALPAVAQEAASRDAALEAKIEAAIQADTEELRTEMKRSADFLAGQASFSVRADIAYEVLQGNGSKLEFGSTRTVTVRRPDRLRIDSRQRDGDRATLYFDGKQIAVDLPDEKAYVAVEKPGTLDEAIDYLVDDLDTPAPLHEFFTSNYYTGLEDRILFGFWVGADQLGEKVCNHYALRTEDVDAQLWIEDGERPLPCRVVITYLDEPGQPQFRAQLLEWDLSPETADGRFAYTPPEGAERMSVQARVKAREAEEGGAR